LIEEMTMSDDQPTVEEFRAKAHEWIPNNLERKDPNKRALLRGMAVHTTEEIDKERAKQRKLFDAGFAGITWPKEYGGQGLTDAHELAFNTEAQDYVMPNFGVLGGTTFGVCAPTMLMFGPPEFLKRHIPKILAGEELFVQFFSEPGAGSDLAGITTRATKDGENWVINGSKIWSSGAYYADWGMCLARTDFDVPKHRGVTWFAIPCNVPGLEIQPIKEITGDIEFCQEFFDDIVISDDERISDINEGWRMSQSMLVFERGGGRGDTQPKKEGPTAFAPDLVELATRLGREHQPRVRQLIAAAHAQDVVQGELAKRVSGLLHRQKEMDAGVAAYGKLASGTFLPRRARLMMEIAGGGAVAWKHGDIQGMTPAVQYLNGRVSSIAGGTNEMQRNGIGERVLGLPREPSFDRDKPFSEVLRSAANWKP
jgi:alkylation response protein AidB-like acyl-CoA dehydrogenase